MNASLLNLLILATFAAEPPGDTPQFNRDIRPLLTRHCLRCHGRDAEHREAGLRLDQRAAATAELDSGATAIVPGEPGASELWLRVRTEDPDLRMPPPDTGSALNAEEADLIRRWIAAGAAYQEHWSFEPPHRGSIPRLESVGNPIDGFVQAQLATTTLSASPVASRAVLIRRLSLDLRGLPPTPNEAANFVNDPDPAAYERLVDRLLHDPAFGERWARLWLDLARYADSAGYGSDPLRNNMWRFRDWVIEALNRNQPYDEFTIEQLAGDLLPDATLSQQMATAFHRNTMTNTEGGTDDEEFRVAAVKDRIETTVQVWMGLTFQCANCHDHKYDPISQHDYYGLFAAFNQTKDTDHPNDSPTIPAPTTWMRAELQRIDAEIERLRSEISAANSEVQAQLETQIKELEQSRPKIPQLPVLQELPADQRRATFVMMKGNFLAPGDVVEAHLPDKFATPQPTTHLSRLEVARWLVSADNPLSARVAVNRIWSQLFGVGLVETEEDFGTQGEPPSHPELLDWLATEYIRLGWDTKRLLRLIVTSHTYRQSSATRADQLETDPRNRLLSRGPRFRLDAEALRDQALALAGLLSRKQYGPSVHPYQPPGLWRAAFNSQRKWPTSQGEDRLRRGIYTFLRRTVPYPAMETFDAPSRELCTVRRIRTNTPLQALVTLNDPVFVEAAQHLARRVIAEGGDSMNSRARYALELCLARSATDEQVEVLARLMKAELHRFREDADAARQAAGTDAGEDPSELAAWTVAASVLLNLDGVLTKN